MNQKLEHLQKEMNKLHYYPKKLIKKYQIINFKKKKMLQKKKI